MPLFNIQETVQKLEDQYIVEFIRKRLRVPRYFRTEEEIPKGSNNIQHATPKAANVFVYFYNGILLGLLFKDKPGLRYTYKLLPRDEFYKRYGSLLDNHEYKSAAAKLAWALFKKVAVNVNGKWDIPPGVAVEEYEPTNPKLRNLYTYAFARAVYNNNINYNSSLDDVLNAVAGEIHDLILTKAKEDPEYRMKLLSDLSKLYPNSYRQAFQRITKQTLEQQPKLPFEEPKQKVVQPSIPELEQQPPVRPQQSEQQPVETGVIEPEIITPENRPLNKPQQTTVQQEEIPQQTVQQPEQEGGQEAQDVRQEIVQPSEPEFGFIDDEESNEEGE